VLQSLSADGPTRTAPDSGPRRLLRRWGWPTLLGVLIGAAVVADALWARSLSLRIAAPWLRGETPPLLTLLLALALLIAVALATVCRGWLPPRQFALITLLFTATQLVGFSLANLEPLKISLLVVCACWLVDALSNNRTLRLYPPILMLWLVILAFAFASILNGLVGSLVAQYTIAAKFLMFFIVANLVRTPAQLLFTVRLLVALGVASAVLALAQEALFYFFNIPLSLEDNATKYWFKETPLGWMIRATAFHPTAQNLSHSLLLALALLVLGPFSMAMRLAGGLLIVLGVFFTFTGNGLVVMSLILLLVPIMHRPRWLLHYVGTVLLIVLLAYQTGALEWVYAHYLVPISGKSTEDRVGLLQLGVEVIERHPFIGIGLNNFGRLSPQPVHNAYLQLVTEIGILPGVLLLLVFGLIAARLLIGIAAIEPGPLKQAANGVLLAFIALSVHFLFEPFINSLVSWSVIGLAEATALLITLRTGTARGHASPAGNLALIPGTSA
jgi:O-antigen ligase